MTQSKKFDADSEAKQLFEPIRKRLAELPRAWSMEVAEKLLDLVWSGKDDAEDRPIPDSDDE